MSGNPFVKYYVESGNVIVAYKIILHIFQLCTSILCIVNSNLIYELTASRIF